MYGIFTNEIRNLKNSLKIVEWQKVDRIDLSLIDYIIIYKCTKRRSKDISHDERKDFYRKVLNNHDYLDLGCIQFMEYLRKEYRNTKNDA